MASKQTERRRLSHVAKNLKASRFLYRVDVMARVESEDDIDFWQYVFHRAKPGLRVKFLPSDSGKNPDSRQRGKTVCMRYVGHLDKHLVVCVDSDFDSFVRPGVLTPDKFIYQTYTYSFENHHCWSDGLQKTWTGVAGGTFDFKVFLSELSHILYPMLIEMLATKAAKKKAWNLTDLCGVILSAQVNRKGVLEDDGKPLLREIEDKVDEWSSNQVRPTEAACDKMKAFAAGLGLKADTAYLYMQGHCVYDLCLRIGNVLCNRTHDFEYEVLKPSLTNCTSIEMSHVIAEVATI